MNFPDKVTCYSDSILSRFPRILSIVQKRSISVSALYRKAQPLNIASFMEILDSLYAMQKIEIKKGVVSYVV